MPFSLLNNQRTVLRVTEAVDESGDPLDISTLAFAWTVDDSTIVTLNPGPGTDHAGAALGPQDCEILTTGKLGSANVSVSGEGLLYQLELTVTSNAPVIIAMMADNPSSRT